MAQIQTNPWSFVPADASPAAVAISSIVNNGGSALVTTGGAHGLVANNKISIQGTTTEARWRGGYVVQAVPSATTFLLSLRQDQFNFSNNGANGNIFTAVYLDMIRAEQILWQPAAAGDTLNLTDVIGNTVWNPASAAAPPVGPYTYGKVFWIRGLVIKAFTSTGTGYFQITVN